MSSGLPVGAREDYAKAGGDFRRGLGVAAGRMTICKYTLRRT